MRTSLINTILISFTVGAALPVASAQTPPALERTHDAPAPAALIEALPQSPARTSLLAGFMSIQVNVNGGGNNVVGDAANEPSMCVDPTAPNRIAIGWRQFDSIASNFRQAGYNYSVDGGRTWAAKNVIDPGVFRSDPVLVAGSDGTFYYMNLTLIGGSTILADLYISTDGGQTWPTTSFAFGGDKEWIAIDNTGGIGDGNIYQAWSVAGNTYYPAQFNRSTDGGLTWETPIDYIPGSGIEPFWGTVAIGGDGTVYVPGARTDSTLWVVRSADAQDPNVATPSFSSSIINIGPDEFVSGFAGGSNPNPDGLISQFDIAVDRSGGATDGNVYVVAAVTGSTFGGSDESDLAIFRSTNGGVTWSSPIRINDDGLSGNSWRWFATMDVAPNGRIDVVWNDTRNSGGSAALSETYYAYSTDAGNTWSTNTPISAQWNSTVGWPNQNKIGDYYDIVSDRVGAHLAYATTLNGEQDVYYLRIGDYDCNGNGIADATDIDSGTDPDCDGDGIPNSCEIAAGTQADVNGNGTPDDCETCPGDLDGDNDVDSTDLALLLGNFGTTSGATLADGDLDGDGDVDSTDLAALLGVFGSSCP